MMAHVSSFLPHDEATIIREIRERVEVGDWSVLEEHFDPHRVTDGFNLDDVVNVILSGMLIEERPVDDRYLFFGRLSGLKGHPDYRGNALHVAVEWEPDTEVIVVTAYRPLVTE